MKTEGVQIHNVTVENLTETVRYDIEYTAPEGMYLQADRILMLSIFQRQTMMM